MINLAASRILPAAVMTFAAGAMLGFMGGRRAGGGEGPDLSLDLVAYEQAMVRELGLESQQQADLHLLLLYYQKERMRELNWHQREIEPRLADIDQWFNGLIKRNILQPDQQKIAKNLLEPVPLLPGEALPSVAEETDQTAAAAGEPGSAPSDLPGGEPRR